MNLFDSMGITSSALRSQRTRMNVIANNVANVETTNIGDGTPFVRKMTRFEPRVESDFDALFKAVRGEPLDTQGVEVTAIVADRTPGRNMYDPSHPDADEDGFVAMPNVDILREVTDMMSASRSYEANVTVFNSLKAMVGVSLEIGR
jgi:flagellar basal-body rod protein FlgC